MNNHISGVIPNLGRFLYTQNPFYLIGTLLVLYGLQQSLGQDPTLATSSLLVGLLAGYAVLLAGIGFVVIRWGQVWDDARTILLVIVLIFFMLSTSLDYHLLFTLEAPLPGTYCLAGGLAFSLAVSEGLLRGLRMGLPVPYRIPYYLVLTLLFAYPALLGWMNYYSYYNELAWVLLAFPLAAAVTLLTLVPAARLETSNRPSGTPWPWPYYPWSLFVFLTIGIIIRAWWLTIAFEPAKGPDTYFRLYFLLPLLMVWAILVLEIGLVRSNKMVTSVATILPLCGLFAALPGPGRSPIEIEFLNRLSSTIGSPAQLTIWSLVGFFFWAWVRGGPAAELLLIVSGILASITGSETTDWSTFRSPQPVILAIVALALLTQSVRLHSSWRAAVGAMIAVAAVRYLGIAVPAMSKQSVEFWKWHAPIVLLLIVSILFDDRLAKVLRALAWRITPCISLIAVTVYPWIMPTLPHSNLIGYLFALLIVSIALWLKQQNAKVLAAGLATLAANLLVYVRPIYLLLAQTVMAKGLTWMAVGLFTVFIALLISLFKMGAWHHGKRAVEWLNQKITFADEA